MSDRELLKLAAKAAAIDGEYRTEHLCVGGDWIDVTAIFLSDGMGWWNPLEDDGDALRLAVTLDLNVYHAAKSAYATDAECDYEHKEPHGKDKFAATRRAIVRVAAEIGKGKL